ncbi:MAG: hypothetical protein C4538_12705 [Nitrospiraceae bacterium]|nr:MAG: hypothetical protein C4538_12705 [Nitrospiraceae bacterium]
MPKVIKKKPVKRKPVEETEEVKHAALHAIDAVKKRQKQAIMIISAIAVIALALLAFNFYSSSRDQKALAFEIEAASYYHGEKPHDTMPDTERWKKALELYQKSIDVKATPTTLYYLGNCYFNLSDYENATKQYNAFIDKFSSNYGILSLVYQKLASAYFKSGKSDKGLEALGNLAKIKNGMFRDTALFMEAKYYESAGDKAKAEERYKIITGEYPNSPWTPEAAAKTAQRPKETPDVTVQPPAAEPEKK